MKFSAVSAVVFAATAVHDASARKPKTTELCPPIDVLLLEDTTQTMYDPLRGILTGLESLMQRVVSRNGRMAVAEFKDKPVEPYGYSGYDYCYALSQEFTSDTLEILTAFCHLYASGGFDYEEGILEGLLASQLDPALGWGKDHLRITIIPTDAPAHLSGDIGLPEHPMTLEAIRRCDQFDYPSLKKVFELLEQTQEALIIITPETEDGATARAWYEEHLKFTTPGFVRFLTMKEDGSDFNDRVLEVFQEFAGSEENCVTTTEAPTTEETTTTPTTTTPAETTTPSTTPEETTTPATTTEETTTPTTTPEETTTPATTTEETTTPTTTPEETTTTPSTTPEETTTTSTTLEATTTTTPATTTTSSSRTTTSRTIPEVPEESTAEPTTSEKVTTTTPTTTTSSSSRTTTSRTIPELPEESTAKPTTSEEVTTTTPTTTTSSRSRTTTSRTIPELPGGSTSEPATSEAATESTTLSAFSSEEISCSEASSCPMETTEADCVQCCEGPESGPKLNANEVEISIIVKHEAKEEALDLLMSLLNKDKNHIFLGIRESERSISAHSAE